MGAQPTDNIEKFRELVKSQIAFHRRSEKKFDQQPERADKHRDLAERFAALDRFLQQQQIPPHGGLSLRPVDLEGLPPEVLAELNVSESDRLHFTILELVNANGGQISLDQVIIGVYRNTGEVLRRNKATNVLYRMIQKGLLYHVPGTKGAYTTKAPESKEDDFSDLIS